MLKLKTPLVFDDVIQSIALPDTGATDIADEALCTISGWGTTMNDDEPNTILRAAEVPIVNQDVCIDRYEELQAVTSRMICAGLEKGGKDCKLIGRFGLFLRLDSSQNDEYFVVFWLDIDHDF